MIIKTLVTWMKRIWKPRGHWFCLLYLNNFKAHKTEMLQLRQVSLINLLFFSSSLVLNIFSLFTHGAIRRVDVSWKKETRNTYNTITGIYQTLLHENGYCSHLNNNLKLWGSKRNNAIKSGDEPRRNSKRKWMKKRYKEN